MIARRLLMGGGGAFTQPSSFVVSTLTAPAEGGWVWFGARRAIRSGDETITGYTTGDSGGDVKAIRINNNTDAIVQTTTLYNNFLLDDHQPPSFVVRPDGIIMAAFAYHVGELYVGIGTSAGVLPAQAQVTNITSQVGAVNPGVYGYTYASIFYVGTRYYIFFRFHDASLNPHLGYTYSDDSGVTWAARTLVSTVTYHQIAQTGDRLDFVLSEHPFYGASNVSHMYFEGGSWFKTDGTQIVASQPFAQSNATLVYNGATDRGWLWDIATGPVIVFVVYTNPYPTGAWTYWYAKWNGTSWDLNDVAGAGSSIYNPQGTNDYAGGIILDHENANVVYYSSNTSGAFHVYRGVTADAGVTWAVTALTSDADKNVRPLSVVGHDGRIQALWLYGTYTDYFTYSQGTKIAGQ